MPSSLSTKDNASLLSSRINKGDFDSYFKYVSRNLIRGLSKAVREGDIDSIVDEMVKRLKNYYNPFGVALGSGYDSQLEELANRFIKNYLDDVEEDIKPSKRLEQLAKLRKRLDFTAPGVMEGDRNRLLRRIDRKLSRLIMPSKLKRIVMKIAKERKYKLTPLTRATIHARWGKPARPTIVLRDIKGRIKTWKNISRGEYAKLKS